MKSEQQIRNRLNDINAEIQHLAEWYIMCKTRYEAEKALGGFIDTNEMNHAYTLLQCTKRELNTLTWVLQSMDDQLRKTYPANIEGSSEFNQLTAL